MTTIKQIKIKTPFAEGSVNAYLAVGKKLTLVDTGIRSQESIEQLQNALFNEGFEFKDIDQIILTHMHTDHSGGVSNVQKLIEVPVYVHIHAKQAIEGGKEEFDRVEGFFNNFIKHCGAQGKFERNGKYYKNDWQNVIYVEDKDEIEVGDTLFQVLHVPGHSQTDICLWEPNTGQAIVGDHLLKDISANAFIEPPINAEANRPKALLQYRESMRRTKSLPFSTIYPGHGDIYEDHISLIEQRFAEHDSRCEEIKRVIQSGKQTIYDISHKMFPWLKGGGVFLGLSEIQGHLDLLIEREEVYTEVQSNVVLYKCY